MSESKQQHRARNRRRQFESRAPKGTSPVVIHQAALLKSAVEEAVYRAQKATSEAEALRFLKVAAQLEAKLQPYLFSMKLLRDSVIRRNATKEEEEARLRQQHQDILAGRYRPWEETGEEDNEDDDDE